MRLFFKELRWSFRRLAGAPAVSGMALVVLALGIGATVTLFTVARAVLIRDLPLPGSDRLVVLERTIGDEPTLFHSPADLIDLRQRSEIFSHVGGLARFRSVLTEVGDPVYVTGASVTPDYLEGLGARPALGDLFRSGEGGGAEELDVAVLSWELWRSAFGGDRGVVGRRFLLDDHPHRVVGVTPRELGFLGVDLWTPGPGGFPAAPFDLGPELLARRDVAYLSILGRLRPGLSREAASAAVATAGREIAEAYPADYPEVRFRIEPLKRRLTTEAAQHLRLLSWSVGLVLLLSCLTVAGLLIGRGVARSAEDDVRRALGASRGQATAGTFAESALLALGGGTGGILLALIGVRVFLSQAPRMPRGQDAAIDLGVLAFAVAVVVVVTLLAGSLPALRAWARPSGGGLRWGRRGDLGRSARRVWAGLLAVEIGLTVVLLVGAGLLARQLVELRGLDLGFDPEGVDVATVTLPVSRYPDPSARSGFFAQLLGRLEGAPGVDSVAAVLLAPMDPGEVAGGFSIRGRAADPAGPTPGASLSAVSEEYFRILGVPVLEGRRFGREDAAGSPPVAIVSRAAARRYWGEESPVGAELDFGNEDVARVVGVVADVRYELDPTREPPPRVYRPFRQNPWPGMSILTRGVGAAELTAHVRRAVGELDAGIPVPSASSMDEKLSEARRPTRYLLLVLGVFAVLAVVMAAAGLYGMLASKARAEEHVLAVRLALGATRGRLVRAQVVYGLWIALLGTSLGVLAVLLLPGLWRGALRPETSPGPGVVSVMALLCVSIAALSSLLPALFVLGLDPSRSLHDASDTSSSR